LAARYERPDASMGFIRTRSNFYQAARFGLQSRLYWFGWDAVPADQLISEVLYPVALEGLARLGIDRDSAEYWLGIIRARAGSGRNGARWQRDWIARHSRDMRGMTLAYLERQERDQPVHEWD
jgi:hypothetical protein